MLSLVTRSRPARGLLGQVRDADQDAALGRSWCLQATRRPGRGPWQLLARLVPTYGRFRAPPRPAPPDHARAHDAPHHPTQPKRPHPAPPQAAALLRTSAAAAPARAADPVPVVDPVDGMEHSTISELLKARLCSRLDSMQIMTGLYTVQLTVLGPRGNPILLTYKPLTAKGVADMLYTHSATINYLSIYLSIYRRRRTATCGWARTA